jgi:hypothetical protein
MRNQHLQNRMREELSEHARAQNVIESTHTVNARDHHVGVLLRHHTKEVGEGISARSIAEPEILRSDSLPELLLKLLRQCLPDQTPDGATGRDAPHFTPAFLKGRQARQAHGVNDVLRHVALGHMLTSFGEQLDRGVVFEARFQKFVSSATETWG